MSGIPQFNFPAFFSAAEQLRAAGFDIVSPAELDETEDAGAAMSSPDGNISNHASGKTWADFLARDVKLIADQVQGVILLPGWERSRGARLETYISLLCGHEVLLYDGDGRTLPVDLAQIKQSLV
jgi:hypothetical protein